LVPGPDSIVIYL